MEACGMAHHWGREAQARGHQVRLLPARDVRPYVRGNETDRSDADSGLPDSLRPVLAEAAREVAELERRIHDVEVQLEGLAQHSPLVRRLRTVPGVGLLTATAIVAAVGDLKRFPSARDFASSLGLTPRESSSGNVRRLGRITKRGDPYLRMLLIHGARSVLHHAKRVASHGFESGGGGRVIVKAKLCKLRDVGQPTARKLRVHRRGRPFHEKA
jgi:transposase